jgi:hypothetical protein
MIKPKTQPPMNVARLTASPAEGSKTAEAGLIHLASVKTAPAPAAETLFIVIESRDPNAPGFYQIQMWRVTVLHTPTDPSRKSPNKT